MREFTTAAQARIASDAEVIAPIVFKIDDVECRAFEPSESQIAVMISATSGQRRGDSNEDTVAFINFVFSLFDAKTREHLYMRLLDRRDPFELAPPEDETDDVPSLMGVVEFILEEATGNPTKPSSDSTRSRATTGKKSTAAARRKELTPSI